jgi:hypothetical protein
VKAGSFSLCDVLQDLFPILSCGASDKQSKRNKAVSDKDPRIVSGSGLLIRGELTQPMENVTI